MRELDTYLRVNQPWLWATRIHIHLFTSLVLGFIFTLVGLGFVLNLRDLPSMTDSQIFFTLLIIPAIIYGVFVTYHMSLYNSDKSFGRTFFYQELFVFLIYIISFMLPLIIPYSAQVMIDLRIAALVDDEVLYEDHVRFEHGMVYFPRSWYDYSYYPSDSIYIKDYKGEEMIMEPEFEFGTQEEYEAFEALQKMHYTKEREWRMMKDSIYSQSGIFEHRRPALYLMRSNSHTYDYYYKGERQSLYWIEDSLRKDFIYQRNLDRDIVHAREGVANVLQLIDKYSDWNDVKVKMDEQMIVNDYLKNNYAKSYSEVYLHGNLSRTRSNMWRIAQAKDFGGYMYQGAVWLTFGVFIYYLAILFNVFKNVHWKQLLLGLTVVGVVAALLGMVDAMFYFKGELFTTGSLILILVCIGLSFTAFKADRFSVFKNQAIVILNFLLPVVPVLFLFYMSEYWDFFKCEYFDQYLEKVLYRGEWTWKYSAEYYELVSMIRWSTFWGGLIAYTLIWNTYLKMIYLRLWALPSNK